MSVNVPAEDLSAAKVGTTGTISWVGSVQAGAPVGVRAGRATLRLFNESGCGLAYTIGVSSGRLPAGGWLDMQLNGETELSYLVEYVLAGQPVSLLLGTIYEPGEAIPPLPQLGNSPIGVGGTVSTSTGNSLQNDGNAPGTQIIEATPSDQAASSISLANDGSGFLKILSAGVLRYILSAVRGNATTGKASVQLGDAGDTAMLQIYGSIGAGSVVPPTTIQAGALPGGVTVGASQVQAGAFPAGGLYQLNSLGGANANPDALDIANAANNQAVHMGYASTGDHVGTPGGYWFDSLTGFVIEGGKVQPGMIAGGSLPAGVLNQNGKTIAGLDSAGPGAAGTRLWCGASDPGPFTVEGDVWAPA